MLFIYAMWIIKAEVFKCHSVCSKLAKLCFDDGLRVLLILLLILFYLKQLTKCPDTSIVILVNFDIAGTFIFGPYEETNV